VITLETHISLYKLSYYLLLITENYLTAASDLLSDCEHNTDKLYNRMW